jgi:hypothetical protein
MDTVFIDEMNGEDSVRYSISWEYSIEARFAFRWRKENKHLNFLKQAVLWTAVSIFKS